MEHNDGEGLRFKIRTAKDAIAEHNRAYFKELRDCLARRIDSTQMRVSPETSVGSIEVVARNGRSLEIEHSAWDQVSVYGRKSPQGVKQIRNTMRFTQSEGTTLLQGRNVESAAIALLGMLPTNWLAAGVGAAVRVP